MKRAAWLTLVAVLAALAAHAAEVRFKTTTIQIGMVVSDLDQSKAFYQDVVGMIQTDRKSFDIPAEFGRSSGLTDSLPFHVEILKLGSGENATELKLMSFGDKPKKQENRFIHSHTGIQYLTLQVEDIAPSLERIKQHGVKMLGETPVALPDGREFILIQDPDGTFVEIIGPKKG